MHLGSGDNIKDLGRKGGSAFEKTNGALGEWKLRSRRYHLHPSLFQHKREKLLTETMQCRYIHFLLYT